MKHTEETKRKLSEKRKGKNNPFFGKKHTEETKLKMAAASKLRHQSTGQYTVRQQQIKIPTGETLAYIAGLIDADGSIRYAVDKSTKETRHNRRYFVALYNSDETLMIWIQNIFGYGSLSNDNRSRKPIRLWKISGARDVYSLILALLPYLIVKKDDALEALNYLQDKYKWEEQI